MLSDTQVKNFKPKAKIYLVADGQALSIEIKPKGTKYWKYRYRFNGIQKIISLGQYPTLSLAQARKERDYYKSLLLEGVNPTTHKRTEKQKAKQQQSQTKDFKYYFNEWLLLNTDSWSDNYKREILKRANKHLLPYIGNESIINIKPLMVLETLKRIESKGLIDTLQKVKLIASQVFRYCVGMAVIQHDPTRDLPRNIFKKKTVKHYSTITDPVKLGQLLDDIDNYNGSFQVLQALRLAPYIFLRPGELASLKWAYIDFKNNQIKLPPEVMKMKTTHIVPLTKKTTQILKECEAVSYESPYVFPSNTTPKTRHITPESLRGGLRRMGYTNDEITTHGFRGIASTLLHEQGFNTDYIERQLAHQERNKIKGAYNHAEYLEQRIEMMNRWGNYLDSLKGNTPTINNEVLKDSELTTTHDFSQQVEQFKKGLL